MKRAKEPTEPATPSESGQRVKASGHRIRAAAPLAGKPLILLVEDNEGVGKTLKKTLEKWVDVTWARNYNEAVEAFSNLAFCALITDMRLGGPSGFEVLEKFQRLHPRTPAMVLTAYFEEADSIRACELGAQYVAKPITTLGLQRFLEDVTEQGTVDRVAGSFTLSSAERNVYALLLDEGASNREISRRLGLSVETVRTHVQRILSKLDVHSRGQAIVFGRPKSIQK